MERLFGKHEKLLNDLLVRFDLGMINDFYSYFREPWTYAIYHDEFKFVQSDNYKLLEEEVPPENSEKIVDMVMKTLKASNWQRVSCL